MFRDTRIMNYKIVLASLLPFATFAMEEKPNEIVIKKIYEPKSAEQKDWCEKVNTSIINNHLSDFKNLITLSIAKDLINYCHIDKAYTTLEKACYKNNKAIIEALLDIGLELHYHHLSFVTRLYNGEDIVELIIKKGVKAKESPAYDLFSPLHTVYSAKSATLLLDAGAELEVKDINGNTPLLSLIYNIKMEPSLAKKPLLLNIVPIFLGYGANLDAQDKYRKSARQHLKEAASSECDGIIKEGQVKYFLRLSLQKLPNDLLKFAQQAHSNIKSSTITISTQQFNIDSAIASTRCPILNLLTQH